MPDDFCCGLGDVAMTSAAGGTIHAVHEDPEAYPGGLDAGRYQRSTDGGRTWDAAYQVPGVDEVLAAVGDRVFIAFRGHTCRRNAIGFVRNTKNGAPNAWSKATCLPGDGSISSEYRPQIAATGTSVYVLSVDPRTMKVHLRTSHDAGRTFVSTLLGDARPDAEDYVDWVKVGADDDLVAATWADRGKRVIRVSRDGGRSWDPAIPLPPVQELSVRDGRILVQGWSGVDEQPWFRLASDGGFEQLVVSWPTAKPEASGSLPTRMVLGRDGALGALSPDPECAATWRTSTDGGATWSPAERIGDVCLSAQTGVDFYLPAWWLDDGRITIFAGQRVLERP
jgi:hypothetical protein